MLRRGPVWHRSARRRPRGRAWRNVAGHGRPFRGARSHPSTTPRRAPRAPLVDVERHGRRSARPPARRAPRASRGAAVARRAPPLDVGRGHQLDGRHGRAGAPLVEHGRHPSTSSAAPARRAPRSPVLDHPSTSSATGAPGRRRARGRAIGAATPRRRARASRGAPGGRRAPPLDVERRASSTGATPRRRAPRQLDGRHPSTGDVERHPSTSSTGDVERHGRAPRQNPRQDIWPRPIGLLSRDHRPRSAGPPAGHST